MRSKGRVVGSVCLLPNISLLQCLFVSQTIRPANEGQKFRAVLSENYGHSHFSFPVPHFSFLVSRFTFSLRTSFLTARFPFYVLASRFSFLTAVLASRFSHIPRFSFLVYTSFLVSHRSFPVLRFFSFQIFQEVTLAPCGINKPWPQCDFILFSRSTGRA